MKAAKAARPHRVRLFDGFLYELRGDKVFGQDRRGGRSFSEVVDADIAKAARTALGKKGGAK